MTNEETTQQNSETQEPMVKQADLDALRSTKDKEVNQLTEQMKSLMQEVTALKTPREAAALLAGLDEAERDIEDNPKGAFDKARAIASQLATNLTTARQSAAYVDAQAKDFAATAAALRLSVDHGGDYQNYKSDLMKATTLDAMNLAERELALELRGKADKKSDDPKVPKVDSGKGSSGPDARQEFAKKLNSYGDTPEELARFRADDAKLKAEMLALK